MPLRVADVVLGEEASRALAELDARAERGDATAASVAKRARALAPVMREDALHGEVVKRGALPRQLVTRHGVQNLYVEDLPGFWRLLYTIARHENRAFVVVVEIVDHATYDRWFGRARRRKGV